MNKIKRDLNFFTAYKNSSAKVGGNGLKGIIIIIICFVMVIAGAYGVIYSLQTNFKQLTNNIKAELSRPEVIETQSKLTVAASKNQLMVSYISALNLAKKGFDKSKVIDANLLKTISSCLPEDVTIKTLSINPQSVQLSCACNDILAPAIIAQAFNAKDIFSSVKYDGVTKDEKSGGYFFNMTCFLGEK